MEEILCPIWQTPARMLETTESARVVESPRSGGRYSVGDEAADILKSWDNLDKVKLTSWLVEQRRLGVECPEISKINLDEATQNRPLWVLDRADALLRYLVTRSELLGDAVVFVTIFADVKYDPYGSLDHAYPSYVSYELLAWTASHETKELVMLAEYCAQEGWIEYQRPERGAYHLLKLRPPGYAHLADIDLVNWQSKQAFVAMWFDMSMTAAYEEAIHPAIIASGYNPLRVDRQEHNNKIDDLIIAEIRRSRFLVADFTEGDSGARGGVYYEAGFAHGLNVPVIFTCRADAISKVHFDTRQYNHIAWTSHAELKERLANRILATVGVGPLKDAT